MNTKRIKRIGKYQLRSMYVKCRTSIPLLGTNTNKSAQDRMTSVWIFVDGGMDMCAKYYKFTAVMYYLTTQLMLEFRANSLFFQFRH